MAVEIKCIILGNKGVGKTSILSKYISSNFNYNYIPTININYGEKIINLACNEKIKLCIYDISDNTKFTSIINKILSNIQIVFLVFDISNLTSFNNIELWLNYLENKIPCNTLKILIANKIDINNICVSKYCLEEFTKKNNLILIETSCKLNYNINYLFITSAKLIYNNLILFYQFLLY